MEKITIKDIIRLKAELDKQGIPKRNLNMDAFNDTALFESFQELLRTEWRTDKDKPANFSLSHK